MIQFLKLVDGLLEVALLVGFEFVLTDSLDCSEHPCSFVLGFVDLAVESSTERGLDEGVLVLDGLVLLVVEVVHVELVLFSVEDGPSGVGFLGGLRGSHSIDR